MAKAQLQVVEVTVGVDSTQCRVEAACVEVEAAVKDCRENGGSSSVIRTKTLSLIEQLFADLEA